MSHLVKKFSALLLFLSLLGVTTAFYFAGGCGGENRFVRAYQIQSRNALIGGPMAVGNVGDYILENSKIRAVISKAGISRAFGMFGGSLIDADRVRGGLGFGDSSGGKGFDTLVEMFPLFFLGVVDPIKSEVIKDGKDGEAVIRVTGQGSSFIALTEKIIDFIVFPGKNRLSFALNYILKPNKNYIELLIEVENKESKTYRFQDFGKLIPAAVGMVGLFGKRNKVFIPGVAGYNIRFSLEEVFKNRLKPPAIPGLVGDFIATRGKGGVSYGIIAEAHKDNYVYTYRDEFKKLKVPVQKGSVLVPLEGSSITACFSKLAPTKLKPGEKFSYKLYLVVGDGSVSSIRDIQLELHNRPKGLVSGRVLEEDTLLPLKGIKVIAYTGEGTNIGDRIFYSEFITDSHGYFRGYLEPGRYNLIAVSGHFKSKPVEVIVDKDRESFVQLRFPRPAWINVTVRDDRGRLLPSKVLVLGKVGDFEGGRCVGKNPMGCLYDLHLGEPKIDTDFKIGLTCSDGKKCLANGDCKGIGDGTCLYRLAKETEYREALEYTPSGTVSIPVRPGVYKIVASRGIEYELGIIPRIRVRAGEVAQLQLTLKHSLKTPYAVSGDFHVHTNFSHDVSISDYQRVSSYAGEGVDIFVTTDHNRIRDIYPVVKSLGLERWLKTFVGVELTTFEMGHFNAFPLRLDVNSFTGGNPDWFKKEKRYSKDPVFPPGGSPRPLKGLREGIPPAEMFSALRKRGALCDGKPDCKKVVVQVNHPRDSIFGYFNAFNISPDSGLPTYKTGFTKPNSMEYEIFNYSDAFDAIELFNGYRLDLLWNWRIPPGFTPPKGYAGTPNTPIRTEKKGRAEIAYPGGVSDWFNFLNRGYKYSGTANSDSHNHDPEAGSPRTYLLSGFDDPNLMTKEKLVEIFKNHRLLMTNGPIIELAAKGDFPDSSYSGIGSTVKTREKFFLRIKLRAVSWIDVSYISIYREGQLVKELNISGSKGVDRFETELQFKLKRDSWFVVTARGKKSLWPVIRAEEIPPFQIGQAVGLIQDVLLKSFPIKISLGESACLLPLQVRRVIPYAITNPIWVDVDGDGKYTPDPCKTLGQRGMRCNQKDSFCSGGFCLDPAAKCKSDLDCKGYEDGLPAPRCIDGKCTVDPCQGLSCAPEFKACSDKTPCPNDACPIDKKVCFDGTPCKKDSECTGKGDGKCRYCACPPPRKACENGKPCRSDSDCKDGSSCKSRRFCYPTACTLGFCEPIYPICSEVKAQRSDYIFLRAAGNKGKIKPHAKPINFNYQKLPIQQKNSKDREFSIKRVKNFFLFFEHQHHKH